MEEIKTDQISSLLKNQLSELKIDLDISEVGEVIYVGKSNSLYERIKFYFTKQEDISEKVKELIYKISDFDYIVTETEQEALLLENQLIKRHKPKYNAFLKKYFYIYFLFPNILQHVFSFFCNFS